MITITDIVGESINLRNGQETPRGLLVSNGISQALIRVSDDDMETIVAMWAESRSHEDEAHTTQHVELNLPATPVSSATPAPTAPSIFNPERDVEDEDDYDQGETYDSGVQSI